MGGYGGGWYNSSKGNKLDVDLKQVASDGALTTKAVGDAFMGVAQVMEDKRKLDIMEADAKTRNDKNQLDLSKAYGETTQKAIDDTYLGYVDTNTGKFNKEQFDKDNVGLPMNQVSMDARLKQKQLENAYAVDLEKIDKKAQEEISNEVVKEMYKYNSKEEFNKNVNPDLIRYANGTTMLAVDKFYNDATVQEAKLANAAAKLENAASINGLKIDLKKQELELEKEKLNNKKNAPKEFTASDASTINKMVGGYFGGVYNPSTGDMTLTDPVLRKTSSEISSRAAEIYRTTPNITHNEAATVALKEYDDKIKNPPPTPPVPDPKNNEKEGFSNMDKMFFEPSK